MKNIMVLGLPSAGKNSFIRCASNGLKKNKNVSVFRLRKDVRKQWRRIARIYYTPTAKDGEFFEASFYFRGREFDVLLINSPGEWTAASYEDTIKNISGPLTVSDANNFKKSINRCSQESGFEYGDLDGVVFVLSCDDIYSYGNFQREKLKKYLTLLSLLNSTGLRCSLICSHIDGPNGMKAKGLIDSMFSTLRSELGGLNINDPAFVNMKVGFFGGVDDFAREKATQLFLDLCARI